MRVRDGYLGMKETIDQILEEEPDVVLHGGDLFHRSQPGIGDITWARRQLERLAKAEIPFLGNTGNHDFANDRGKLPATAALDDPDRNIHLITDPYRILTPIDGLNLHFISHIGLLATERIMPEPIPGEVNIFISHGAAQVPGHPIFACVDSPGEAVIGYDVLAMPWNITLLGHYHAMNPLPGFDERRTGQAWYAGSLLRRGFSDPQGGRGWLLVTVNDDGTVDVERKYIKQRPQEDLSVIDGSNLTSSDIEELIVSNLNNVEVEGAILRQRVINCSLPIRRGIDISSVNEKAKNALTWQLEFVRPAIADFMELPDEDEAVTSLKTAGSSDLPTMWNNWFEDWAETNTLPKEIRPEVAGRGSALLEKVSYSKQTSEQSKQEEDAS